MFIRIIPNQVPQLWDQIKYAAIRTDSVSDKDLQSYLNNLLQLLLNSKVQCFLRISNDKKLLAVVLTEVRVSRYTGDRSLLIRSIFSFESTTPDEWESNMKVITEYAKASGCKSVVGYSSNSKIIDLALSLGFRETYRYFVKDLEA